MIHNHWRLTPIPPAGSWTLTVPRRSCIGCCWRLSSLAGGRGRLRGRRGLKDAVCRERPHGRQRAQLPGPHRGRSGRFHFARGWAVHGEDDGHETVQPALRHHVSHHSKSRRFWRTTNVIQTIFHPWITQLSVIVMFPRGFQCFVFASFSQAGAGGAAPGGARGEEETPQEPERVRGPVLQTKRKVKKDVRKSSCAAFS